MIGCGTLLPGDRRLKMACAHEAIIGKEFHLAGSVWEFPLPALTEDQRALIQFGLDAGFGELNSLGFGFMNVVG